MKLSNWQIAAIVFAIVIGVCYYRSKDVEPVKSTGATPKDFSPPPEPQPAKTTNYTEKTTYVSSSTPVPTQWDHSKFDMLTAYTMAQKFVTNKLVSPSTAEFSDGYSRCTTQQNDTTYIINSYVDSQNSFGAMIRTRYVCQVTYHPKTDSIFCTSLNFLPR